jgi:hypothetical protein
MVAKVQIQDQNGADAPAEAVICHPCEGSEIVIQTQKRSSKRRNSAGQLLANRLQMR